MEPPVALVRRPGPRLAEGLRTHIDWEPVDPTVAAQQWEAYAAALAGAGWQVREVPPADDHPDAVFVEDTVVLFDDLAILTQPGALERRGELAAVESTLQDLDLTIDRIDGSGILDGGDVLTVGTTVYAGLSSRTTGAGIHRLARLLARHGTPYRVQAVPVERVLHLKTAVTALPDGTVLGWDPVVDDAEAFPAYVPVPEAAGANVVRLADDHLLLSASAPATAEMLRARGYRVTSVDIGEFEKLEGGVTCLSVRVR